MLWKSCRLGWGTPEGARWIRGALRSTGRPARKASMGVRGWARPSWGGRPGTERRPLRCVLAPRTALGLLDWLRLCQPPGQVGRLPL